MKYVPGLAVGLVVFWFAMSGLTSPLFLGLSAVSVLATLVLVARLRIIDRDSSPYHRAPQLMIYTVWLVVEIIKANLSVLARVVGLRPSIDPAVVEIRTTARSATGRALFANSITLTPGTVTIDIEGDLLKVHALVRDNAGVDSFGGMDSGASRAADPVRKGGG